jgi:hypothetical protein
LVLGLIAIDTLSSRAIILLSYIQKSCRVVIVIFLGYIPRKWPEGNGTGRDFIPRKCPGGASLANKTYGRGRERDSPPATNGDVLPGIGGEI